ncbi:hypothetical protein JCM6882_007757 [Rhodosporidiobolus microsporus]
MATATTPNGRRYALQPTNTRSHSVRTASRQAADRPAAPDFYEERVFLNALGTTTGAGAAAGPSQLKSHPMQTTRVEGSRAAAAVLGAPAQAASKKRGAAESTSPDPLVAPQAKKSKVVGTAAAVTGVDGAAKRKMKRATAGDKEKLAQESAQWRAKYKKAFPSFTFYFDAIDEATKAQLSLQVRKLGASVDNFFSKKVTHVVTTRSVPTAVNKENVDSPAPKVGRNGGMVDSAAGKTKKQSVRSPKMYSLANGQKLRPGMTGDLDKNPFIDSQDILSKALDFGLKIWQCDKLQLILERINSHSPNKVDHGLSRNPSLPSLLRDEQLYGTRERDPFVPRNDMHYFRSDKQYFLVEDSTAEHRPIVVKEYERPRKHEDPQWPILWGGIEGRTGFYHYEGEITYERKQPPPQPIAPQPADTAAGGAKASTRPTAPNLRRAISLQNVARGAAAAVGAGQAHHHHAHDSYLAASGNSQIITSNIQSATSTAGLRSGAAQASRFAAGQGPFVDKRLAVLSNRTVSVAGGALLGSGNGSSASGSASAGAAAGPSGGRVAALKRQGKLQRSVSVDAGLSGRRALVNPAVPVREEPKKPGYCENCRLKYDDFKDHVVSSKHRRFALKVEHWVELDELLGKITRPLRPTTVNLQDLYLRAAHNPSSDGSAAVSVGEAEDSGFFDAFAAAADKSAGAETDSQEDDDSAMSNEDEDAEESNEDEDEEDEEDEDEEEEEDEDAESVEGNPLHREIHDFTTACKDLLAVKDTLSAQGVDTN